MILVDNNIPEHQVETLRRARLRPQQIGREVGRPEWQDLEEILRYLHRLKSTTFITRDEGFFRRRLCHRNYCIVVVSGLVTETAVHVRRFLRHTAFLTKQQGLVRWSVCRQQSLPGGRWEWRHNSACRGSFPGSREPKP